MPNDKRVAENISVTLLSFLKLLTKSNPLKFSH